MDNDEYVFRLRLLSICSIWDTEIIYVVSDDTIFNNRGQTNLSAPEYVTAWWLDHHTTK